MDLNERIALLIAIIFCITISATENEQYIISDDLFSTDLNIPSVKNDSLIKKLELDITKYKSKKDTAKTIDLLLELADQYESILDYAKAYSIALEALTFSQASADSAKLAKTYLAMCGINISFGKSYFAIEYINNAISINKQLSKTNVQFKESLAKNYFYAAIGYRKFMKYDLASEYIDSCMILSNSIMRDTTDKFYIHAEMAYLLIGQGYHKKGQTLLLNILDYLESQQLSGSIKSEHLDYQVFVNSFLSYSYLQQNKLKLCKKHLIKALNYINEHGVYLGMKHFLLYNLSIVLSREGDMGNAYKAIFASGVLRGRTYGRYSSQNLRLIETKSRFEDEINKKNEELYHNNLLLARNKNKLLKLRVLFTFSISLLVFTFLIYRNRNIRKKYAQEKEIISREKEIQDQVARNIVEIKNKELTTYTLQLLEKDKVLNDLVKYINERVGVHEAKNITKSINSRKTLWNEFNHRFNSVNKGFYERLHVRFPGLSSQDLKHCALIKLNFSGKEMSHLLGISTKSVHMARYRLRSKMNLSKGESLNLFIAGI